MSPASRWTSPPGTTSRSPRGSSARRPAWNSGRLSPASWTPWPPIMPPGRNTRGPPMGYSTASVCRCCGSGALERVLDLGRQPLANSYLREPAELPTFPLELMVCRGCFHNQLSVVVEPDLMFRHYLYV